MTWNSAFAEGNLDATVTYVGGSPHVLYTGSMGLSSSTDFDDANGDDTCTLAIDSSGVVTLSSTNEGWTGGEYAVELSLPAGQNYRLVNCSVPQFPDTAHFIALDDGTAGTDFTGSDNFTYPDSPASTFGFGVTPGGG